MREIIKISYLRRSLYMYTYIYIIIFILYLFLFTYSYTVNDMVIQYGKRDSSEL